MNKEPFFLFIIPTFNSYKKLPELVYSLRRQTFENWEVKFIDGDSNKYHKEWLQKLSLNDDRFKIVNETKKKKGIYLAMNIGCKNIKKNNWIIFMGSDDTLHKKNSLEELAHSISKESNKNLSLVISNADVVNPKIKKIIRRNYVPNLRLINKNKLSNLFFRGYVPAHQAVCFSGKVLKNIPLYSDKFLLASDLDMFIRLSKYEKLNNILFVNKTIFNVHTGGISSKLNLQRLKEVINIYFKYYGFNGIVPLTLRYLRKSMSILSCKFLIQ